VPVDPGRLQGEVSTTWARGPIGLDLGQLVGVLTLGVAPGLDVAVQGSGVVGDAPGSDVRSGVGDTQLQSKWLVVREGERRPALLVSPVIRLPTGEGVFSLPGVDVQALGVAAKTFGPALLNANVGYTFATSDRSRDAWTFAASGEWKWSERLSVGAEAVAGLGVARLPDSVLLRGGVIWRLRDGIVLDAAVASGVHGPLVPDVMLTVGATIDLF